MALKTIIDFQRHYTKFLGIMHGTHVLPFTMKQKTHHRTGFIYSDAACTKYRDLVNVIPTL